MLGGMEQLLPIGRFARRGGLTVGALRHYHQHRLLEPAWIDPVTGYRSYAVGQLEDAASSPTCARSTSACRRCARCWPPIPSSVDGGWAPTAAG
jgi:hypothetical protein